MTRRSKWTAAAAAFAVVAAAAPASASAGGQRIAYSRSIENEDLVSVFSICPDGSGERRVAELGIGDGETAWSAAHRRLVYTFVWKNTHGPPTYLVVGRADGTHPRKVPNTVGASEADWAPNGRKLVFVRGSSRGTA